MQAKIILRPATVTDIKKLARLWVVTFPDKFGPILGSKAERIICDWLRLSQRHLQTTTLVEVGGIVAGYIVLETPSMPRPNDGRWLWYALQLHNGIFGALRSFLFMVLIDNNRRPGTNEVCIEMLGVAPAWRGEGLAARLMAHAQEVAQSEGVDRLYLNVVSDNLAAFKLYQKMGFEIKKEHHSRILKWITGHNGFYEMVKQVREA